MTRKLAYVGAAMAALLILPVAAHAQTAGTSTSGATSNSMTNVYPTTVPTTANGQVATDPAGFSPYNTHSSIDESVTRQAPALSVPSVYGLNPCGLGASLGVTTPVVGVGGSIMSTDAACEARNNAALAISAFHNEFLAREVVCEIKAFRDAWARIGKPCLSDQKTAAATSPMGNAPAPLPAPGGASSYPGIVPVPVPSGTPVFVPGHAQATPAATTAVAMKKDRPSWCSKANPTTEPSRLYVQHVCG